MVGCGSISAQQFATVEVDPRLWEGPYVFFAGSINDVPVTAEDTLLRIQLASGFDTIRNNSTIILCRMKPGKRYRLRFNPCSSYEFLPVKNPKMGLLRTRITGSDTTVYQVGFSILRPVTTRKRDRYYYEVPSGMCSFSAKHLRLELGRENVVTGHYFHYLHGEKMTLHYDHTSGQSRLTLDGYVRGTRYRRNRVYYDVN